MDGLSSPDSLEVGGDDGHDGLTEKVDVLHVAPDVALTDSPEELSHHGHGEALVHVNVVAELGQAGGEIPDDLRLSTAR